MFTGIVIYLDSNFFANLFLAKGTVLKTIENHYVLLGASSQKGLKYVIVILHGNRFELVKSNVLNRAYIPIYILGIRFCQ